MSEWVCSICLCNDKENTIQLGDCNHMFHSTCIVNCLRINGPKCPNCRGLDKRCQFVFPNEDMNFEDYSDNESIHNDEEIINDDVSEIEFFDETSEFDMEIQQMLLNIVDNNNQIVEESNKKNDTLEMEENIKQLDEEISKESIIKTEIETDNSNQIISEY